MDPSPTSVLERRGVPGFDGPPMKCSGRAGPHTPIRLDQSSRCMQKYVVSTTLQTAPWKESTIIRENVVEAISKLKQQPGKDIIIDGSATLVHSLMGTDLIDKYRFLVVPYIMGSGRRFWTSGTPQTALRLVSSKMISAGTLALIYQPDKK